MEDIDFSFRAQKQGKIMYLNQAVVIHHSGQSQRKNYNVAISNQLISKLKYYKKNENAVMVFLADVSCFIFIVTRIIAFCVMSPFAEICRLKAKAYFYTFVRFLRYIFKNDRSIA